jgi:RHS repeat-associated protein
VWKGTGGAGSDVVVPHLNWRGLFGRGTDASGNPTPITIEWPGFHTSAYHSMGPTQLQTRTWMGSLLEGQRDAGGQMYMRNRYYDPATGQFTQPDPIGIAGGLNVYGFAAGDPVGYWDPFGLCPESLRNKKGRCPGNLSVDQYNSIETSAKEGLTGGARDRILDMLQQGDIRLVRSTGSGQPAAAKWRGRDQILVTEQFFTSERPANGNGNGYGSSHERAWVLAHELGHLHQAEMGILVTEIGTGVQPNHRRVRRLLNDSGELAPAQVDANAYACRVARNPGAWASKPGCGS